MKLLDKLPFPILAVLAIAMGLAPFYPQPHLLEKLGMLLAGNLTRPIDIFDLFWHGLFPVLLLLKLIRMQQQKKQSTSN